MKHPARSDFRTVVTAAGVSVTFKPTNSAYSFYRLAETALSRSRASNTKVEKWMPIIREINREQPDRHHVDYVA